LFWSNKKIRDVDRGIGNVDMELGRSVGDIDPAEVSGVASTLVPKVGEFIESDRDGLDFGESVVSQLFIEFNVVSYLSNMNGVGVYVGRFLDQIVGRGDSSKRGVVYTSSANFRHVDWDFDVDGDAGELDCIGEKE